MQIYCFPFTQQRVSLFFKRLFLDCFTFPRDFYLFRSTFPSEFFLLLSLMSANLIVPVFLCCPLGVVQPTQQCVLAKLLLDFQGDFLQASLFGGSLVLLFLLLSFRLIVRKEVELYGCVLLLPFGLGVWSMAM